MKSKKLVSIKEKQAERKIKEKAQKNFDELSKVVQNPIQAKLLAFQKTKKEINPKDLL